MGNNRTLVLELSGVSYSGCPFCALKSLSGSSRGGLAIGRLGRFPERRFQTGPAAVICPFFVIIINFLKKIKSNKSHLWAGLLDIRKQRETELWPGGKTGPMYYLNLEWVSRLNSVSVLSERRNGPPKSNCPAFCQI